MIRRSLPRFFSAAGALVLGVSSLCALEPPTGEQLERYRRDGSLSRRVALARSYGNHRTAPRLVDRFGRSGDRRGLTSAAPTKGLPSIGQHRVFALLIDFADQEGQNANSDFDRRLFGLGAANEFPYESLRSFYQRSSYGKLDIRGSTLGWYTTSHERRDVSETYRGRELLVREAIEHFDRAGHDFSQYDNDGDGEIDYFLVFWAGPHGEWGEFWWGYQVYYEDASFEVDGMRLGSYSWQWEGWEVGDTFSARVAIHETGHALGLPDFYDYDDAVGPRGGLGDLDMMDSSTGDHNCFSKYLLGWVTPQLINEGLHEISLMASDEMPEAALLMHGNPRTDPFGEYFMVQYRRREGNDDDLPSSGLMIWHIDARLDQYGWFRYDNSYTDHKLIRLMEADGLEEIERGRAGDVGDFYAPGDAFDPTTIPDSDRYDGAPTNLAIATIRQGDQDMSFRADLGSGCALFCEVDPPQASWPNHRTSFVGAVEAANCQGTGSTAWLIDGETVVDDLSVAHVFADLGTYDWSFESVLGDATCSSDGSVLACADERCWGWSRAVPMAGERLVHAAQTLADGRVLVAGGGAPAELYDPVARTWSPTGPMNGYFAFAQSVLLEDGRVLVVGGTPGDPVSSEIYDPVSNSWQVTGGLNSKRAYHSVLSIDYGRVMVAGGVFWSSSGAEFDVRSIEIFDPLSETWTRSGHLAEATLLPGLSHLPDGRVLVTENESAEIFDPSSLQLSAAEDLLYRREYQTSVALRDGRILVTGGFDTRVAEIYDPQTGSWTATEPMSGFRLMPELWVDPEGRVFYFGGFDRHANVIETAEVFDPADGSWTVVASMSMPRLGHRASQLPNGTILVTGGMEEMTVQPYRGSRSVEIFKAPVVDLLPRSPGRRVIAGN